MLKDLLRHDAFALIKQRDGDEVMLLSGTRRDVESLADLAVVEGIPETGDVWDSLVLVPFAQVRERGFEAHADGTPLSQFAITSRQNISVTDLLQQLPREPLTFTDRGGFDIDDDAYAEMVDQVIADEIGQGEGANLVVGRRYRAQVANWGHDAALSVFANLLERERGAFWTFLIFTGDRYLIGASPERHVSVDAGTVRMNPISGTLKLRGLDTQAARHAALLDFLRDEKEIYELFMVVDEELKQMCDICHEGGLVLGPYLKPMSHLMHTEYLLAGRTHRDVREVLRDSMFAATVTGSPVENACRLIKQYEQHGRGYYAAVAALIGRDADGKQRADAPILIRTADVDLDGNLSVTAGATLVRDSDPHYETQETWAKASGILSAFGLVEAAAEATPDLDSLTHADDVLIALGSRNQRLSQFWLTDQSGATPRPTLQGKRAIILDNEDDFVNMISHVFGVLGISTDVVRHDAYSNGDFNGYDLVVLGPGPGDPRDTDDPKIATLHRAAQSALDAGQPTLAVCLGHQVVSHLLGFDLTYKDIVFQGTQSPLTVLGRTESVGFYNTFVARVPESGLPAGVRIENDPDTGDIHALYAPRVTGIQFHAESILTQNGDRILGDLIADLLS